MKRLATALAVAGLALAAITLGGCGTNTDEGQYISDHGQDATAIQADVRTVLADIKTGTTDQTDLVKLAGDAQDAHDNIDKVRDNLATDNANDHEVQLWDAANDLKLKNDHGPSSRVREQS